ncbi:hypothetical protein BR93DRAFT_190265 [Coniochaeta sp. PMI_546]|nr:hypothetical protein BR93DRAFT_190265 [Coniochaeta sp. PMI_546]
MQLEKTNIPTSLLALTGLQTLIFIVIWVLLRRHVATLGPLPAARRFSKFHNILYSTFNIALLVFILLPPADSDFLARRIYHITKTYEYMDILTVCASGSPIALHFAVHHLTTPWLSLCRVLYNSDGWRIGAVLNVFHHIIMYAYFGGLTTVRRVLPVTGMAQLLIGLVVEVIVARKKILDEREVWPNVLAMTLALTYLGLFVRELWQSKPNGKVKES